MTVLVVLIFVAFALWVTRRPDSETRALRAFGTVDTRRWLP